MQAAQVQSLVGEPRFQVPLGVGDGGAGQGIVFLKCPSLDLSLQQ